MLNIADYENFLILLGSVFVPMFAVLVVDFFLLRQGPWDLSPRPAPLADAAAVGRRVRHLPAHQPRLRLLVGLGVEHVAQAIGFTAASWMSASICSFVVAAVVTLAVGGLTAAARQRANGAPLGEAGGPVTGAR